MKNSRACTHACIEGYIQGCFVCLLKFYFWLYMFEVSIQECSVSTFFFLIFFLFSQEFAKEKGKRSSAVLIHFFLFLQLTRSRRWSLLFLSLVALRFTSFVLRTLLFEILFFMPAGSKGWWAPASATALGQRVFFLNNSLTDLLYFFPWNVSWICWFVKGSSEACTRPLFCTVSWLFIFLSLCYKFT